ncbi:hypothetical protein MKW94_002656 [Papaver nudicaule]|uniref:nucleoside-diphosphate kinase n=1 Tax=Papaver nudicaule TaxID=74823 RepID=A0AA41V042_PAPNU|nr:hypothetical protein [Papaver nudicaule]
MTKNRSKQRIQIFLEKKERAKLEEVLEETFFLGYPVFFRSNFMGRLVSLFEKDMLQLKGMMLMHVNERFIKDHFRNVGGEPEGKQPCNSWVAYLTSSPVIAMILEGKGAVNKVHDLTSNREKGQKNGIFWNFGGPTAYSSNTSSLAAEDIKRWFHEDKEKWLSESSSTDKLIFLRSNGVDGEPVGPWQMAYDLLKKNIFYADRSTVVVIKPRAFRERCVGRILSAVEDNSYGLRGLKLVKKADCPRSGGVWSDSDKSDDCAVAVAVDFLFPLFGETPDIMSIDFESGKYQIGSDYLYRSTDFWRDIQVFFPYGVTLWTDSTCQCLYGEMFEPSLIGLWEQTK